jgi:hypothetical protein
MTTPLTPPTFGDRYNVGLTDIGSGYAAGITSAGQSIAGAIGAVMGGINQRTGEVQPGILDQKKSSEDMLDMLKMHGMMTDDEYEKAKSSSLGAQQKFIGQTTAEFNMKLQAQLEQQKALAVQQAESASAITRQGMAGQSAETVARIGLQRQNPDDTTYARRPPANAPVPLPNRYAPDQSLTAPLPSTKLF